MRKVRAVVCLLFFCVCDVIVATVVLRNVCEHRRPCPKREAREFGRASPPPAGARCVCNCMTPFENWECEVFTIGTQGLQLRLRLPRATPLAGACWRRSRVAPARGREDGDATLGHKDETCWRCVRWRKKSARRRSVERGAAPFVLFHVFRPVLGVGDIFWDRHRRQRSEQPDLTEFPD